MIYLPKKHIDLGINTTYGLRGTLGRRKYKRLSDGTLVETYPYQEQSNLILNQGIDLLFASPSMQYTLDKAVVGTGTTEPSVSQTALDTQIATSSSRSGGTVTNNGGSPLWEITLEYKYLFDEGVAAGNLTEFGIKANSGVGGALFCRELFRDGVGDPIVLTVLSDELLEITYKFTVQPSNEVTGSITIASVNYDYWITPVNVTSTGYSSSANPWLSTSGALINVPPAASSYSFITDSLAKPSAFALLPSGVNPAGTQATYSSFTSGSYTAGDSNRDFEVIFQPNKGNISGGVKGVLMCGSPYSGAGRRDYQMYLSFSEPVPKDDTKRLAINFNLALARV